MHNNSKFLLNELFLIFTAKIDFIGLYYIPTNVVYDKNYNIHREKLK